MRIATLTAAAAVLVGTLFGGGCASTAGRTATPRTLVTYSNPQQSFSIAYDTRFRRQIVPHDRGHWVLYLDWPEQAGTASITVDIGDLPKGQTAPAFLRSATHDAQRFARSNEHRWKVKEHVTATTLSGPSLVRLNGSRAIFLEVGLRTAAGADLRLATYLVPSGKRLYEVDYCSGLAQWSQLATTMHQAVESFTLLGQ